MPEAYDIIVKDVPEKVSGVYELLPETHGGHPMSVLCATRPCVDKSHKTYALSAVSTPIFTTKYSFCSVFRNLQNFHSFAPLKTRNFSKIPSNFVENMTEFYKFSKFCKIPKNSAKFRIQLMKFCKFSEFRAMLNMRIL